MSEWQKTCDEIGAAEARATEGPWCVNRKEWTDGGVHLCERSIGKPGMQRVVLIADNAGEGPRAELADGNAEFTTIAANNAPRLARFSKELSKEAMLLWAKVYGVKIGADGTRSLASPTGFNELLDRLWQESK